MTVDARRDRGVFHLNSQFGLQAPRVDLCDKWTQFVSTKFVSLYLCISAPITPHREVSSCSGWYLTQKLTSGHSAENKHLWNAQSQWNIYITAPILTKFQELRLKVADRSEGGLERNSIFVAGPLHEPTAAMVACIKPEHDQVMQHCNLEERGAHEPHA